MKSSDRSIYIAVQKFYVIYDVEALADIYISHTYTSMLSLPQAKPLKLMDDICSLCSPCRPWTLILEYTHVTVLYREDKEQGNKVHLWWWDSAVLGAESWNTWTYAIFRLLCTGKTNSPFPVSVCIPSKLLRPYLFKTCRAGILSSK